MMSLLMIIFQIKKLTEKLVVQVHYHDAALFFTRIILPQYCFCTKFMSLEN